MGTAVMLATPVLAQAPQGDAVPQDILPAPSAQPVTATPAVPMVQPVPSWPLTRQWRAGDARILADAIEKIGAEGLSPADYGLAELRAALAAGEGPQLDEIASRSFAWLAEDLRDGRTPMDARRQWFASDADAEAMPTGKLLEQAVAGGDVAGLLASLAPTHPEYARLKAELAATPAKNAERRALVRANMDRWRWLPRDLGKQYLIVNVPEMMLRLMVNNTVVRSYRTIVGKPGRTATPQFAETVEGVIFNPTWTVPQSIVVGEGLGPRLLANPAAAKAKGYKAWRDGESGQISVVQQPGPNNALGLIKLDMPNPHAIFLHDTPSKELFNTEVRAYSHGCIRTERAMEMGMTVAILGKGASGEEAIAISKSGEYTRVPLREPMPVYITYFTMGSNVEGAMSVFPDIYDRDAPVLASLASARQMTRARTSEEEIVPLENGGI